MTAGSPPVPGTPIETELTDYYDRLIFVGDIHDDFPEPGHRSVEYVSYPKDLSQAVNVEALLLNVKEKMGLTGTDESEVKTALKEYAVTSGGSMLSDAAAAVSYALRYDLPISYHRAVLKGLAPLEDFDNGSEPGAAKFISRGQSLLFPISPSEQNRLTTTIGLEGEWFVGRTRGIIFHKSIGTTGLAAVTTGLPSQSTSISAVTWTTEFSVVAGVIPIDVMFKGNIPLTQGEYILLRGGLDRAIPGLRASSLVRGALGEMWTLTQI
jgi:hypothetical protein